MNINVNFYPIFEGKIKDNRNNKTYYIDYKVVMIKKD